MRLRIRVSHNESVMPVATRNRTGGTYKFVVVLLALAATVVAAIEWSRRTSSERVVPAQHANEAADQFPRELRDASGEILLIPSRPKRIVSQTLGTDEILLAICKPARIVALSSLAEDGNYSNIVEESRRVAGPPTQGAEQILLLEPDLILVASYSRAETVKLLKASRAPVFRIANFDSISDIKENIRTVGKAIGNEKEAESVILKMDESLAAVRLLAPPNHASYRIMSFEMGGFTAGKNTTFDEMVRAAGAKNVSAENGIDGIAKISVEKIIDWQPDFIVAGANQGDFDLVRKKMLENPVIAASRAGRAGRIIVIDNRHFLTVSQYVVRGVEDLAKGMYGQK
jgi:iron complex transport system substrate-binding protein